MEGQKALKNPNKPNKTPQPTNQEAIFMNILRLKISFLWWIKNSIIAAGLKPQQKQKPEH